ncbi:MAG: type II secretion system protein [Candidatus Omnitrophota bacterium]|nr:type II secretion system protein [Candidatus Omnitrophota bacterium]
MRQLSSQRGLTLIELMISMGILLITVLLAFYVLTTSQQMAEHARGRLSALNAARSVMEAIKDTSIDGIAEIVLADFVPDELQNAAVTIATNPTPVAADDPIATVTVTVAWTGPNNRDMALAISTMKSR